MSVDPTTIARTSSPANSGRSSPNPRARQKDGDDLLKKDKSLRRYAVTVERALAQFTAVEEWADYVSFLSRLLKALQARPSGYTDIAHKQMVAKRLAQCLNPVLGTGVHQKTLEVYGYIFSAIGQEGLSADLSIYLPGLAPTLSFVSLSVKPIILKHFETYIVKLDAAALRPALKALILSLLPSLEEENSEEYEWSLRILEGLKTSVAADSDAKSDSQQYFWQCLFLASMTSSSRRPGALAYLVRNLPSLAPSKIPGSSKEIPLSPSIVLGEEDERLKNAVTAVAAPDPGLLIRSFCAGLEDEQLLIQRGFLDLLVSRLPLHSEVLQKLARPDDLQRLIVAATSVVSRRDMSLNRRLWSWFLGPEPVPDTPKILSPTSPHSTGPLTPRQHTEAIQSRYFEDFGLVPFVNTIKAMIKKEPLDATERSKPLRICLSMMDKWELSSLLVPRIFLISLQSAWQYRKASVSKEAQTEVINSANMFFDMVESSVIWAELAKLVAKALTFSPESASYSEEKLDFVLFITNNFNIREEEMQVAHMPLVSIYALTKLRSLLRSTQSASTDKIVNCTLQLVNKLVELIPARVLKRDGSRSNEITGALHGEKEKEVLLGIEHFYTRYQGNIDKKRPVAEGDVGPILLSTTFDLLAPQLQPISTASASSFDLTISILGMMIRKGPRITPAMDDFVSVFQSDSKSLRLLAHPEQTFAIVSAKVLSLETIFGSLHSASWMPLRLVRQCIPGLVADLWPGLSPTRLKHNVEAARSLWRLQSIAHDTRLIESTITTLMISHQNSTSHGTLGKEDARRFATLWSHSQTTSSGSQSRRPSINPGKSEITRSGSKNDLSMLERPLMFLLDSLDEPKTPTAIFVLGWLQSLPTVTPIFEILLDRLFKTPLIAKLMGGMAAKLQIDDELQDSTTSLYYLEQIGRLLDSPIETVWRALGSVSSFPGSDGNATFHEILAGICMRILDVPSLSTDKSPDISLRLKQTALSLLSHFLSGPLANSLAERKIELMLLDKLSSSIHNAEHVLQTFMMDVLLLALKIKHPEPLTPKSPRTERRFSRDMRVPSLQVTTEESEGDEQQPEPVSLPPQLLDCLLLGMSSPDRRPVLEKWVAFLGSCLPLYEGSVFQVLIPLVECFCTTLSDVLEEMKGIFASLDSEPSGVSESTIALLLNGLEHTLAAAHEYLEIEEAGATPVKSPEQQQSGFFGNMVSGVFTNETTQARSQTANKRLTVLLCFKDAIRISFKIWLWGDSGKESSLRDMSATASFNYITLRLRNRTRRLFEHLFAVEPLECLETLVDLWQNYAVPDATNTGSVVLNLLNALEKSRPKNTMPAIFDAIYSRTNPGALDPHRKSTLTSEITDNVLASFLVIYARSLEDDAMDEVWGDCSTFLKDVLANPLPHRQTLYRLLEFTAVLGGKVANTSFGEQRKMRRELGDLFNKLLAATLTIRPMGLSLEGLSAPAERSSATPTPTRASFEVQSPLGPDDLVSILSEITPELSKLLVESDRIAYTAGTISTQILIPTFRSKAFPSNVNEKTLELMKALAGIAEASKSAKKDVTEAFNDPRFFYTDAGLVQNGWLPVLRSWVLADKERLPELLLRLTTPTTAGFLGVGANSARLEGDRKAQLNLRRIATLILAAPQDAFVVHLKTLQEKINDLLGATSYSSPSTVTRAEVYMVLRALLLRISVVHLSALWPTINAELFDSLATAYPGVDSSEALTPVCILQACKLLDVLLLLGLDDFQMQEWLFVRDTTDAVYPPNELESTALVEDLAESLDTQDGGNGVLGNNVPTIETSSGKRRPLLTQAFTADTPEDRLLQKVIRPFLRQLSIQAFESTYSMLTPDLGACESDLIADLFDDTTLV